jgi:hypothetical protein
MPDFKAQVKPYATPSQLPAPVPYVCADHSNAYQIEQPGHPVDVIDGYPAFYPIGIDPKTNKKIQAGPPRLYYDGSTHESAEAIEAYKVAKQARDENLDAWQKEWDAQVFTGPVPATSVKGEDAAYEYAQGTKYYPGDLHRTVLSGSNTDINRVINEGEQKMLPRSADEVIKSYKGFLIPYVEPVVAKGP